MQTGRSDVCFEQCGGGELTYKSHPEKTVFHTKPAGLAVEELESTPESMITEMVWSWLWEWFTARGPALRRGSYPRNW